MSTYAFGAPVRLSTEVRDSSHTLVNPSTITVTVMQPSGTTSGPHTPASDGVGLFHYDLTPAQAGRHIARWVTTSPGGVTEETFDVAPEWGQAGIISLADAKAQLNIDADDTSDDEEISDFLRSVTRICERYVGALARATHVETHAGGYMVALNHPPVLELTSVEAIETNGTAQQVADLALDGQTGIVRRLDGAKMCGPARWTYVAGRALIEANVSQAARILLQHMWETQRGQMGGVRVGGSDEVYDPRFGFAVPRRVQELLGEQPPGIA
jgi:hypothetical protein